MFNRLKNALFSFDNLNSQNAHLSAEQLEPRILYSAAPIETAAAPVQEEAPAAAPTAATASASASAPVETAETTAVVEAPAQAGNSEISAAQDVALVDVGSASATLNQQTVETLAAEARQRWIDSGISAEQIAALDSVSYDIADVGGAHLGVADGFSITIDDDAGGTGIGNWFVDVTPGDDVEFGENVSAAGSGRFDLLSTLIHEQGHVLGLGDLYGARTDVMDGFLDAGTRRLPVDGQADGAVAGSVTGENFLTAHTTSVVIDGGGNLVIEDIGGADTNDNLFIGIVDGRLEISDTKNTVGTMIAGATEVGTKGRGVSIDLGSFSGDIIVRTLGGDDVVTFGDLNNFTGGVLVEDSDGHDVVKQTGEIALTGTAGLQYTVEEIRLEKGSSISVEDGDIALLANQGETSLKKSVGIFANGSSLTSSGGGDVAINGIGGIVGNGNRGVDLRNTSISTFSGLLTINGLGGDAVSGNEGVRLGKGTNVVKSGSTSFTVIGTGRGTGNANRGITIQSDVVLNSAAGSLNIFGTGAVGKSSNIGVFIQKAELLTNGPNTLQVFGTGKGTGSNNVGAVLKGTTLTAQSSGQVSVFGIASSTSDGSGNRGLDLKSATIVAVGGGNISVSGSGGTGTSSNSAVKAVKTNVTSNSGFVSFSGTASSSTTKNANRGVNFSSGSISASTTLTLTANGGGGLNSNEGLRLESVNLTAGGLLKVTGSASTMTTGSSNRGASATEVELAGSGVDFRGTGGNGTSNNEGMRFEGGSAVSSASEVLLRGIASNSTTGSGNRGAYLSKVAVEANANATLSNFGGAGVNSNVGLFLDASTVIANNGSVNISGAIFGTTTGKGNYGTLIKNTEVSAATDAAISGSAGAGTNDNSGLTVSGGSFDVAGTSISFNGSTQSTTTGTGNYGAKFSKTTVNAVSNTSIFGAGGGGTDNNYGAQVQDLSVISQGSIVSIQGATAGTTTGKGNFGARLTSTDISGSGAFVSGSGGTGSKGNYGLHYATGSVTATTGNISVGGTADAATTSSGNSGATLKNVVVHSDLGSNVSVSGTGGGGTNKNHGVRIDGGSLTNDLNSISVIGNGNVTATGSSNFGLRMSKVAISAIDGLNLVGNAGGGTNGNFGAYIASVTATAGGEASVSGFARSTTGGSSNYGLYLNKSSISGTDLLDISGTGGGGVSKNWGTRIIGGMMKSDNHLDMSGTADANTTGTGNSGVYIFNGVTLIGANLLEIGGTGGGGEGSNFGVFMNKNITADGAMVNGMATDSVSEDEAGDFDFF